MIRRFLPPKRSNTAFHLRSPKYLLPPAFVFLLRNPLLNCRDAFVPSPSSQSQPSILPNPVSLALTFLARRSPPFRLYKKLGPGARLSFPLKTLRPFSRQFCNSSWYHGTTFPRLFLFPFFLLLRPPRPVFLSPFSPNLSLRF